MLAEESAPKTEAERAAIAAKPRLFFVDPVDGTREFSERNGQFCVMIGLVDGAAAVAGVVVVPVENKLLWGSLDGGTYLEPLDGSGPAQRVAVSQASSGLRALVSRSHPAPRTRAVLEELGIEQTVPCGSVGLQVTRVIEGASELYVHPSRGASLWDACAPDALLRGAGGVLTALDGAPIDYPGPLPIETGLIPPTPGLLPRVLRALEVTHANTAKTDKAAKDFEAVYISEMLKPMFETVDVDDMFGGGKGEEVFRGLLVQEMGKSIAKQGGLGLADQVKVELLKIQEHQGKAAQ